MKRPFSKFEDENSRAFLPAQKIFKLESDI